MAWYLVKHKGYFTFSVCFIRLMNGRGSAFGQVGNDRGGAGVLSSEHELYTPQMEVTLSDRSSVPDHHYDARMTQVLLHSRCLLCPADSGPFVWSWGY